MKRLIVFLHIALLISSCASKQKTGEEKRADLYYSYGTSFLVKQDYTKALTNLLKAYKIKPDDSKINNNLGMAYYFKGQNDIAKKHILKAIEINPKASDAKNNLASIYLQTKEYPLAKKLYNEVLNDLTFEEQFRTFYNLALVDFHEGNYREAITKLEKSIQLNESYCPSHLKLGEISYKFRRYEKALNHFNKSQLGSCYNSPFPQYHQVRTLIKLKRNQLAKQKLLDLMQRFPGSKFSDFAQKQLQLLNQTKKQSFKL